MQRRHGLNFEIFGFRNGSVRGYSESDCAGQPAYFFLFDGRQQEKISLNACQGELFDARLLRLADVMGRQFGENSLLIDAARENLRISGYVSLPTLNKANSLSQYLFVNNRPVRDKLLLGAIKGAYQDVLASNRYPMCALFLILIRLMWT